MGFVNYLLYENCPLLAFYLHIFFQTVASEEQSSDPLQSLLETLEQLKIVVSHQQIELKYQRSVLQEQVLTIEKLNKKVAKQSRKIRENKKALADSKGSWSSGGDLAIPGVLSGALGNISTVVAFSAYVNHSMYHYADGETINFRGLAYDMTGHYDPDTSSFVCPVDGLYMFNYNIYFFLREETELPYQGYVTLLQDGVSIATVAGYTNDTSSNPLASNTVFTYCISGQEVHAEAISDCQVYGISEYRRSTFSGILLAI